MGSNRLSELSESTLIAFKQFSLLLEKFQKLLSYINDNSIYETFHKCNKNISI